MQFLNFTDIASIIGLEKNEADYPGIIALELSAIASINDYLYRDIVEKTLTESFQENLNDLPLINLPVTILSSVNRNGNVLVQDVDFKLRTWGIELINGADGYNEIDVIYTGGYTQSSLPNGIYRALLIQTIYEWQNRDHIGSSSVTTEGGSVQRPQLSLLKEAMRILNIFRHPMRGQW